MKQVTVMVTSAITLEVENENDISNITDGIEYSIEHDSDFDNNVITYELLDAEVSTITNI